ncbi:MAG: efflux RND transporter periplasmic adaptor subunit [Burkholderiales bacterium]|nr:efflux RND transporter periplasmic adaptor subunit [Phycisphaerae bacterium]
MTNKGAQSTVVFSVLAAAVLTGLSCSKHDDAPAKPARPPVKVQMAPVVYSDLEQVIEVVGTLYGEEDVTISSKVSGRVTSITADLGDRVAGAAQLAQIDPTDYQLAVTQRQNALQESLAKLGLKEIPPESFDITQVVTVQRASSQAANAQAKLERARKLFEQKPPLISEQEFADLATASEVAKRDFDVSQLEVRSLLATAASRRSELATAQEQLANTRISAPPLVENRKYAVALRSTSTGEYVREGTAMFRLLLDDQIKFRGSLPERYFQSVRVGQPMRVSLQGEPEPAAGTVSRVSPAIDLATRTFQIEATFNNSKQRLRPGAFVRGDIAIGVRQNVPRVPKAAVLSFAGVNKVYSVRDGKAIEHTIVLGQAEGDVIAVLDGLKDQSEVAITGLSQLANQVAVEIQPTTRPATSPAR